jgi:hypothetical protein
MDWEEHPAPELAALYKCQRDGSETALREAKAPLRGIGPGTGPMLRSGSPAPVRQELAAWAAATGLTRGAGLAVRPHDLSHARAVRGPVRDPPRERLLPGRDQRTKSRNAGASSTATASPSPLVLRARGSERHRHPHRPRHHHHGQHPGLISRNTANPPERARTPPDRGDPAARRDTPHSGLPAERNYPQ